MKKILSVILALIMVLSLCACAPAGQGGSSKDGFQVGYARENITPKDSVPLMGYGDTWKRLSTGFLDYLYATAVAIKDPSGNTIIMITADSCTGGGFAETIQAEVSNTTGIPTENIVVNVTHSHSTPDFDQTKVASSAAYHPVYKRGVVNAAVAAVEDLKPATIYYTATETENLNFIRHVKLDNGKYKGDNFGHEYDAKIVGYAEEIDNSMQLLKIDRGEEAKPIVMMTWRAHPTITGGSTKTDISADYVGSVREYLEKTLDCHFAYYQGCAGNVNPRSYIVDDDCTRDYKLFGKQLGGYAVKALEGELEQIKPCTITAKTAVVTLDVNHTTDHLVAQAQMVLDVYNKNYDNEEAKAAGEPYGIYGKFDAQGIIKRASSSATVDTNINGIVFGDQLAIVGGSNELFSSMGVYVKENSPVARTIVLGYTNGQKGYMPTEDAFLYKSYEAMTSRYGTDSAMRVATAQVDLIKELTGAE